MKIIKLDLIKKNRIWIDCKTESGYLCKLKVCDLSKDLSLGLNDLFVEDISVRSKYGVDLKFQLKSSLKQGICSFRPSKYNCWSTEECRNLGGKWDNEEKSWIFSIVVSDKIDEMEELYNSEQINIEISLKDNEAARCWNDSVDFLGYPLAIATGRDSGAKLSHGVYLMQGKIDSYGSVKNWGTIISGNSILRLEVSKKLFTDFYNSEKSNWIAKIL